MLLHTLDRQFSVKNAQIFMCTYMYGLEIVLLVMLYQSSPSKKLIVGTTDLANKNLSDSD